MNVKNAKTLSQKEMRGVLPSDWVDIFDNMMSIVKHSTYSSFKHAERFLVSGLGYIPNKENSRLKHVKTKCSFKGEHEGKIYITLDIWLYMKNECFWIFSKSIHVLKREKLMSYD